MSHLAVTNRHGTKCLIWLLQADIVPELAPCYESEDETMGRRNKVASDLHLQRNKRGTRLYSKDDFREHYCITSKQLDVLERARGSGLFGCLSNYHVSSMYACHCTDTSTKVLFSPVLSSKGGSRWRSWLRYCAKSRKVEGSIPDGVTGISQRHTPSGSTLTLGLTQPLTEMSTRNISWGVKAAGAYGWQPYHLHVPIVLKCGILILLEPQGLSRPVMGLLYPFTVL